ncbi:hypothetical protein LLH03_16350 [bacterium]|nr:hypothetical protein [bacterium]
MRGFIIALALALASVCAWAAPADTAVVGIGSDTLFTVASGGGMTAAERQQVVAHRLVEVLSILRAGQDPKVEIRTEAGAPVLYAAGLRLICVTQQDAKLHRSTMEGIALVWSKHADMLLRKVAPVQQPTVAPH